MRLIGRALMLAKVALAFSMLFLFLLNSCAKHPSESQLDQLERQKAATLAAEKKVQERRSEKVKLQETLKEKKSELRELEKEREAIKTRVTQ